MSRFTPKSPGPPYALAATFAVVAGCAAPPPEGSGVPPPAATPAPTATPAPVPERVPPAAPAAGAAGTAAAPSAAVPAELLRATRADLDARLAAAKLVGTVRIAVAESVTWNDGSLGCGKPGMNYTMALVPGYRVVYAVRAGDVEREYAYHAGRHGHFVYCENPGPPPTANTAV